VGRSVSADGRYVCKSIESEGQQFVERVRLFGTEEITSMLLDAGITLRHRFGDYQGAPLSETSPRTILLGQAT
jgi:hypothetical protein